MGIDIPLAVSMSCKVLGVGMGAQKVVLENSATLYTNAGTICGVRVLKLIIVKKTND